MSPFHTKQKVQEAPAVAISRLHKFLIRLFRAIFSCDLVRDLFPRQLTYDLRSLILLKYSVSTLLCEFRVTE